MPATVAAIGTIVANASLAVGEFVGNTLVAAGVSGATAASIATTAVYATDVLIAAAPSLILAATLPAPPGPQALRLPLRQSRPARQTGVGTARISGPYMLFESEGQYSYDVFALHDGKVYSFDQWWLNDDKVTVDIDGIVQPVDQKYKRNRARMFWTFGEATETAFAGLVADQPGIWSTLHRGDGIASLYLLSIAPSAEMFPKYFPNGLPLPSATAKLSLVYDPRDPAQDPDDESTWEWSANPALGLLFYLCFTDSGPRLDYGQRILPVVAHWKRAADVCDESVPLAAGGTTPRYQVGGVWTWDTAPAGVIGQFLDCMDGWMGRDAQGCVILKAGKYEEPTVTLTREDVFGFTLNRFQPAERAVNELVISYTSPEHDFNMVQTDPWTNDDDIAAVGEVRSRPLALPWVPSNSQARRLAKRAMTRQGADATGTITIDLFDAFEREIVTQRYVAIQLGEYEPQTLRDIIVEISGAEIDVMSGLVTLSWVKADSTVDSWDAATEEGAGPTGGTYIPPVSTDAPTINSVGFDASPLKLVVTIADPARTDITLYYIQYRQVGTVTWTTQIAGLTDIGTELELRSDVVSAGIDYEVQVAYLTDVFALSDWSNDPPDVIST